MSGKIKENLIGPLMDMIKFNGKDIDNYIQYDIINDSDKENMNYNNYRVNDIISSNNLDLKVYKEDFGNKINDNNYVKCKKGHEYCFECLRKPHGDSSCDEFLEKELLSACFSFDQKYIQFILHKAIIKMIHKIKIFT